MEVFWAARIIGMATRAQLEACVQGLAALRAGKRNVALLFRQRPDPQAYADYYAVIAAPIALDDIAKHVADGAVSTIDQLNDELLLMVRNAQQYNTEQSQVYQ